MSSIHFFIPVVYNNQNKTISQQVLETVLRVASYFTIIVALAMKALLRRYLQVASIQLEQRVVPISRLQARLPIETLEHIASFLSDQDQAKLAQVALFTADAARNTQQNYIHLMAPLKAEIEALPAGPLSNRDFQRLLVGLVTSPALGHPKYWVPVMDALMGHLAPNDTVDGIIQKHAYIANLLATSARPIPPDQMYQFCKYLGQKQLSDIMPWISYRALEQYALKSQLNSASVNKALKEYLTLEAKVHIIAENDYCLLSHNRILTFQETDIDPRKWFGFNGNENSLWAHPGAANGEIAPMPELLLDVLWTRIQSLRACCIDEPFTVSMWGRREAQVPDNFTLTLAQRITNADIFLDHNNTERRVEKQQYLRSLEHLSNEEKEALAYLFRQC